MKKGLIGFISIGVVLLLLFAGFSMCTCKVPAGYVAVQYNMNGGVKDKVLTQGWHLVSPTIHTTNYTIGIEQSYLTSGKNGDSPDDESFSASTSEGKAVQIDLTFTYQYDVDSVTKVFTQFKGQSGKEVRDSFIKPNIVSWTKEVIARYAVADILGSKRAEVNTALTEYLAQKFEPYGISISNVSLINIEVDSETQQAINDKIQTQQKAETQAIQNQTDIDMAEAQAKAKKIEAQGEADAQLIEAQANADAMLIEANAEAEANKTISESITDEILDKMYYDTWNGELPTVVGDTSTVVVPTEGVMD